MLGSKLPLFPYNRGWETQPNNRVLYTNYEDSVIKGGRSPIPKKMRLFTMAQMSSVENPGWLFDIGDYTTQLYGDYNKPI